MEDHDQPIARPEPDWCRLFPEMADWIEQTPSEQSGDGLALSFGRADTALALAEFSWPSFVVIDDMVFRAYSDDTGQAEAVAHWLAHTGGDRTSVEWVLNHEHFWHLVPEQSPTAAVAMHWGALVREMWSAKLARDFPDRKFVVELHTGPDVEMMDHQITFYQVR